MASAIDSAWSIRPGGSPSPGHVLAFVIVAGSNSIDSFASVVGAIHGGVYTFSR
jgi:hypothetical protein